MGMPHCIWLVTLYPDERRQAGRYPGYSVPKMLPYGATLSLAAGFVRAASPCPALGLCELGVSCGFVSCGVGVWRGCGA